MSIPTDFGSNDLMQARLNGTAGAANDTSNSFEVAQMVGPGSGARTSQPRPRPTTRPTPRTRG